jgi:hypothetical protein
MQQTIENKAKPSSNVRLRLHNLFGMADKFIIQGDKLILGKVMFHNQLKNKFESKGIVHGGGAWHVHEFKDGKKMLILYGESTDFGMVTASLVENCIARRNIFGIDFTDVVKVFFSRAEYADVALEEYFTVKVAFSLLNSNALNTNHPIELTPETFLESKGISLQKTTFTAVIDDFVRSPDLCALFDEYAQAKMIESQKTLTPKLS